MSPTPKSLKSRPSFADKVKNSPLINATGDGGYYPIFLMDNQCKFIEEENRYLMEMGDDTHDVTLSLEGLVTVWWTR